MGGYNDTYLYVDFSVLVVVLALLVTGNVLMFFFVVARHQRRQQMATLNRLIIGMDANPFVALSDIFFVADDAAVVRVNDVLKQALAGDTAVIYTTVFETFSGDGSLNTAVANKVKEVSRMRYEGIVQSIKDDIAAEAARA